MGLALTVDKIDTVPEAQRPLYVEKEGKFHLDVDGLEDTTGLKAALKAERTLREKHEKSVRGWEKLGKTAEEITTLIAEKEAAAEEAAKKAGNFDGILATHKTNWAKEKADSEAKLTADRDKADSRARKAIVDTRINNALTKGKATQEGLDLLVERLGKRIKLDFADDKETISILDSTGEPMVGTGKDGLATFDDLVKEAVKQYPSLFEGTGGGGGAKGGGSGGGAKTITRADFEKMTPLAARAKLKEGFTVV